MSRGTMNEEHGDRPAALGEFVSSIAGELNNRLTAVVGYAQILSTLEGTERSQALREIEDEALRASRVIRNLLPFGRQNRPQVRRVDLNALLERVAEVERHELRVDGVEIVTELGALPELMVDESQMEQVFVQLMSNAHQWVQSGGGTVTIASERAGDYARITVSDNGPGLLDEIGGRVFDPFFTADVVGSWMGMAVVYGIVSEHCGRVWVQRTPAGGGTVVVELPLRHADDAAPDRRQTLLRAPERAAAGRILVVDDEPSIRLLVGKVLSASGYHVETAASGDQALEMLAGGQYDLVITDVRMPSMNGAELSRRIGERWPRLRGRVLFMTGSMDQPTSDIARAEKIPWLQKPFQTSQLLQVVRDLLHGATANDEGASR